MPVLEKNPLVQQNDTCAGSVLGLNKFRSAFTSRAWKHQSTMCPSAGVNLTQQSSPMSLAPSAPQNFPILTPHNQSYIKKNNPVESTENYSIYI